MFVVGTVAVTFETATDEPSGATAVIGPSTIVVPSFSFLAQLCEGWATRAAKAAAEGARREEERAAHLRHRMNSAAFGDELRNIAGEKRWGGVPPAVGGRRA